MTILQLFSNLAEYHNLEYEFSEKLELLYSLDFEESGMILKQVLEESYTDGIDGFENVENDGNKITGIFLDRVSSGLTKRYQFEVTENKVSYKLLNPGDLDKTNFSELSFATTTGTAKKRNCVKGTACGSTCIGKDKECGNKTTPASKEKVKGLLSKTPKAEKVVKPKAEKVVKPKAEKVVKPDEDVKKLDSEKMLNVVAQIRRNMGSADYIPISEVRKYLADNYSQKEVDDLLRKMNQDDKLTLTRGDGGVGLKDSDYLEVAPGISRAFIQLNDEDLGRFDRKEIPGKTYSSRLTKVEDDTLSEDKKESRKQQERVKPKKTIDSIMANLAKKDPSQAEAQERLRMTKAKYREMVLRNVDKEKAKKAEENVKRIINDPETDVFIRIPNNEVLDLIMEGGFKNAHEIGGRPGTVTDEQKRRYLQKREDIEYDIVGYSRTSEYADRPIYGYLASNNLNGKEHEEVGRSYGGIAVKLKKEVKARTTFTGADTFKSGFSSKVKTFEGDPDHDTTPPPDITSLIPFTRLREERATKEQYVETMSGTVQKLADAKDIHDIAKASAPGGFSYLDTQIHGGTTFDDIDSIYLPDDPAYLPSDQLLSKAKEKGVKIYIGNKLVKLED